MESFLMLQQEMSRVQKSKKPVPNAALSSDLPEVNPGLSKPSVSSNSTPDKDLVKPQPKRKGPEPTIDKNSKMQPSKKKLSTEPILDKISKVRPREKKLPTGKNNKDPNIPNRLYGDYYCEICDSHMNSEGMWEAHIIGKRHLKNIKKGDTDPKYEDLDVDSCIKHEIRNVRDPVVGLSYIHEIRRKEVGAPPLFTCFLCQATFASVHMLIEHVLTMKHRQNYMKENSPDDYKLLEATNLKKVQMEPLVADGALKLEQKFGRGVVKVKQERIKQPLKTDLKRTYDSEDDDDMPRKPKIKKFERKNSLVWKAVDCKIPEKSIDAIDVRDCREIIEERRRNRYSSDEENDTYKQEYHTKQSVRDSPPRRYKIPSRKEAIHSKTHLRSPEKRYTHSRTVLYPQETLKKDSLSPRSPPYAPPYECYPHSSLPPQESLKKDPRSPPDECLSHSRSYQKQEKDLGSSRGSLLPPKKQAQRPDPSEALINFVQNSFHVPMEIFCKIASMRFKKTPITTSSELTELANVINDAYGVFRNRLPTILQAEILNRTAQQHPDSSVRRESTSSSTMNEGNITEHLKEIGFKPPGSNFNFMRELLNHCREGVDSSPSINTAFQTSPSASHHNTTPYEASTSANQNVSPYQASSANQNVSPYQASSASQNYLQTNYSTFGQNNTTLATDFSLNHASLPSSSDIPGLTLTGENGVVPFNTYQPYPDQSTSYSPFRY